MPELPEVETIRLNLSEMIIGLKFKKVIILNQKSFFIDKISLKKFIINQKIVSISRRAKILMINLDNDYSLVFHLKMTGQIVFVDKDFRFGAGHPNDSFINKLPDRSTRVILVFSNNSKLFFNDQRKFGWIKLLPSPILNNQDFFRNHGPEPLESSFSVKDLKDRLVVYSKRQIKAALLDQSIIAGLGNIYTDESLWLAKINPRTKINQLSDKNFFDLHKSIQKILNKSIELGGSTDRNYVNARGEKGSYLQFANVFRKENQPCPRCGNLIVKEKIANRGTHYCPKCQKLKD